MRAHLDRLRRAFALLAVVLVTALAATVDAATITIVNNDGPGEGLNDPTPATPVGGNPGTTVGDQRLFVYNYAASIWGSILPSSVPVLAVAAFNPLSCSATSGVLGSAGPINVTRDFPGAPVSGHWYHIALANKLAGIDLIGGVDDINSQFNSNLGTPGCLETTSWYYGVDGNAGSAIDFLSVVLHELGHGLGFSTTTSGSTGLYASSFPHIYDRFLLDNLINLHWDQMSNAQRQASAIACNRLVWDGAFVAANASTFLGQKPVLRVHSPAPIAKDYDVGAAAFGPPLTSTPVTGNVVLATDGAGASSTDACEALTNGAAVNGNIALVDRGNCPFTQKVLNAQNAGAIGVLVADNVAGCPPAGLAGSDGSIVIPSVRITLADGNTIKANLAAPVNATLVRDPALLAGADAAGRVKMYTPSTFAGGSSVSHWDTSADPDLLMEPFNTPLAPGEVDLSKWHFADIGWFTGAVSVADAPTTTRTRIVTSGPNPFAQTTTLRLAMERVGYADLSVHDMAGRRVAVLHRGALEAGNHAFEWNGEDRSGRRVAPGMYVYRLTTADGVESRRVVLSQ